MKRPASDLEALRADLHQVYDGDPWHGSSITVALEGIDADIASRRSVPGAHTIWEIVRHVTTWAEIARERLRGESLGDPSTERDWPPVTATGLDDWRVAIEQMAFAHRMLAADVREMTDEALDAKVKDLDYPVGILLDGVVEHGVYHAGQIVLLKKAGGQR